MASTEIVNIQRRAENVTIAPQQIGYSKVRIHVGTDEEDNEIVYEAGNESGSVLEINNPFGTQQMAENILADIAGMQYQPGKAEGALIDPAAELGDSIVANNSSFGMYIRATEFGRLMKSDAEAPTQQEIEHEFGVEGSEEREYIRATRGVKAMLQVQAAEIAAKVSIEDRNMETGFGWSLTSDQWRVGTYSGSSMTPVLTIDENGLTVYGSGSFSGEINATSGTIGGLTISNSGITSSNGNFSVDSFGNLTAQNGTFAGAVYAKNIQYGISGNIDRGYFPGYGIDGGTISAGKIVPYDLSTGQMTQGVRTSLGWGDLFGNATQLGTNVYPSYFYAGSINGSSFFGGSYMVAQDPEWDLVGHKHALSVDSNGNVSCGPARSGSATGGNFNIADTQFFKDAMSAAGPVSYTITPSLNSGGKSFSISVVGRYSDGTSKVVATGNTSNAAYQNGEGSVSVSYSGGSYDIWLNNWGSDPWYGYWVEVKVKLTNGKTATSARLYLD